MMKLQRVLVLFIALLGCVGTTFLTFAVIRAREAARESTCRGKLAQLQFSLMNYEAKHGHLPPAYIAGPDGKPWHSWRVLILPCFEEQDNQYRFDEPWNGPNNRKLADRVLRIYQCPGSANYERKPTTTYMAVVGNGTAFPGEQTTRTDEFHDGLENTILLVEVPDSDVHWMEPRDVSLDALASESLTKSTAAIGSKHPAGPAVVFADSIRAYRLHPSLQGKTLHALSTIAGDEPVTRKALVHDDTQILKEK